MISRQYDHEPRHFRFPRRMEDQPGYAIEDCGGQSRIADKIVVAGAIVVVLLMVVVL